MMATEIKVGDVVSWLTPLEAGDADARYIVTEVNGDRCFIRFICDMAIAPVTLARTNELIAR